MSSFENDPMRNLPLVIGRREGEKRAATWQIVLTACGVVGIVTVFLWGINNQRDESAGQQTAATMPSPATPQNAGAQQGQDLQQGQQQDSGAAQQQGPSTTGQGGGDEKNQPQSAGQKSDPQPVDSNGEPAHRRAK